MEYSNLFDSEKICRAMVHCADDHAQKMMVLYYTATTELKITAADGTEKKPRSLPGCLLHKGEYHSVTILYPKVLLPSFCIMKT